MNNFSYLSLAHQNLPRVLSLFDDNPISPSFGLGDRHYSSWKTSDFADASYQRLAHGLALLVKHDLLPQGVNKQKLIGKINTIILATEKLLHANGSVDQAYPNERSYGATAFVAFDLFKASQIITPFISTQDKLRHHKLIDKMIGFLLKQREAHGFISNHLAAAANLLIQWHEVSKQQARDEGINILNQILARQSAEGWFLEYDGADPGYQTLCLYYLADLFKFDSSLPLHEALTLGIEFETYFAHPDGSFGGLYGSRNTQFFLPAGFELLANQFPKAGALAFHMQSSLKNNRCVTLSSVDSENLIPFFNNYVIAAINSKENDYPQCSLPYQMESFTRHFKEAGLYINNSKQYYSIVSLYKGGVFYSFDKQLKLTHLIDTGIAAKSSRGILYSSQHYNQNCKVEVSDNQLIITQPLAPIRFIQPTPLNFLMLRFLGLTFLKVPLLSNLFKKTLVKLLITKRSHRRTSCINQRVICLAGPPKVSDHLTGTMSLKTLSLEMPFSTIHMASQGYWQSDNNHA